MILYIKFFAVQIDLKWQKMDQLLPGSGEWEGVEGRDNPGQKEIWGMIDSLS